MTFTQLSCKSKLSAASIATKTTTELSQILPLPCKANMNHCLGVQNSLLSIAHSGHTYYPNIYYQVSFQRPPHRPYKRLLPSPRSFPLLHNISALGASFSQPEPPPQLTMSA